MLLDELKKLCIQSQFHGLPRLFTRKSLILKTIWLVCILASLGVCILTLVRNIEQYLSFGVNTLVRVVPHSSIDLPTISICNTNPLATREAFEYIASYYSSEHNVTLTTYSEFYDMVEQKRIPDEIDWLQYSTYSPTFNDTQRSSFGIIDRLIFSCKASYDRCGLSDMDLRYHPRYGNCLVYNFGEDIENITTEEYGLQMFIFTGVSDTQQSYLYEPLSKGFVIVIDDPYAMSLDQDGILLKPGSYANIALSKSTSESLPKPYNDCYESDSVNTVIANEMRQMNLTYRRRNCFTLCKQMIIIERLGCYDMRYPRLFNASPCANKTSFDRLKSVQLDLEKCQNECPFECSTNIYHPSISYATFPNYKNFLGIKRNFPKMLRDVFQNQSYSYTDFQKVSTGFFVYFDSMNVIEITQSPSIDIGDLISNIGGNLGIFIGIGFVNMVEILEIFIVLAEPLFKKLKCCCRNRTETNQDNQDVRRKSTDNNNFFSMLGKELKRAGKLTTLDPLPNMLSTTRNYMRAIWFVFFLVSIGACAFMLAKLISGYLKFGLTSKIRQMPQENLTFPAVVICSTNNFVTKEGIDYLNENYLKTYGRTFRDLDDVYDYIYRVNDLSILNIFNSLEYDLFHPKFNLTLRKSFAYSLDDILIKCEFNSKPCNRSWFEWVSHPFFPSCFAFNSGGLNGVQSELLNIDKAGKGLYMELFVGLPDEYYHGNMDEWQYNAINIIISSQGHLPINKFGRPFKAGTYSSFKLNPIHYVNLPAPYSDCQYAEQMKTDIVERMRKFNITYSRYNCISLCQESLTYGVIGCYSQKYPNIFDYRLCENYAESKKDAIFHDDMCPIICPSECEERFYDFEMSSSDFPSVNYGYKMLNDEFDRYENLFQTANITFDMLKKSVASFHFYYDDLKIDEIIEQPTTLFIDLVANIGGILGLFVGLSVLSFVELIELCFNFIRLISSSYKRKTYYIN